MSLDGGSSSLYPPAGPRRWTATFGSALACTTTGQELRLESVDYHWEVEPRRSASTMRTVELPPDAPGSYAPVLGRLGPVDHFTTAPHRVAGDLAEVVDFPVRWSCDETGQRFTELLTELDVGPAGAWVRGFTVHYTVEGRPRRLDVDWDYVACGTRTVTEDCEA